ncbi:hypothetical protein FQZ97_642150 [compost metagenome]
MDGRQDQVVLVEQRRAGPVAGGFGRIERELGEKAFARAIAARQSRQLLDVGTPHARGVFVQPLQVRLVPLHGHLHVGRPLQRRRAQGGVGLGEVGPLFTRGRRRHEVAHRRGRVARLVHRVEQARAGGRPHAGNELRDPEARHAPARVLRETQHGEQVLHMRGLEELEPAELHERDVAPRQFQLERRAVRRGAKQHRLRLQRQPALAVRQDLVGHPACLPGLVGHEHQHRLAGRGLVGPQRLGVPLGGLRDDAVRHVEDRLRRAVVALQRDDARLLRELRGKVEDVAHRGAAERVDRLRVVAHHRHAAPVGLHRAQDLGLQQVGVLVLVDQHVVEARADVRGQRGLGDHLGPVEQEVVVVEHVLLLLGLDVGAEQRLELGLPLGAPGKVVFQHGGQRRARVHAARVDRQAGALARKAVDRGRQPQLVPHQPHEVFGVAAVVDGEVLVQPDLRGVLAQQPRADAVEGAGPRQRRRAFRLQAQHARQHLARAALHFLCGAAREGEQQQPLRIDPARDQVRHAVRQRAGLARAGTGDHEQRPVVGADRSAHAVLDRRALVVVERGERRGQALGLRLRGGGKNGGRRGLHGHDFTVCPSSPSALPPNGR